jgi:ubiquinone/menaquinone biosynthesis C-methylase UbiE
MPDCSACSLFQIESQNQDCLHVNRPGGLELTRKAVSASQLPAGSTVLDAACGTGATLDFLERQLGMRAIGVDLSRSMLARSSQQPQKTGVQASCLHLPLPAASLDAVLMECALSLTGDLSHTLCEFRRVLQPGGSLIITDLYIREGFDTTDVSSSLPASSCLAGTRPEAYIRQQIEKAGFQITTWQDETTAFKEWLARMVFKLGSLHAVYRRMVSCDSDARKLAQTLGSSLKLGYYCLTAQKSTAT